MIVLKRNLFITSSVQQTMSMPSLAHLWLRLLPLLLFACLPAFGQPAAPKPMRPNLVVLLCDDLGYQDVGCYSNVVKTPNMDRIAQMGVKFTAGYVTAPLCGPSRAGFFTGRYQERFGFVDNSGGIPAAQTLLPGTLHEAGYHTGLIGKWHSTGPMPHLRGCFDESLCSVFSNPFINYHHPTLARNGKVEHFDQYSTDLFGDEAVKFIENHQFKPFSLTVTFNAPHILRVLTNAPTIRRNYDAALAAGKVYDVPKVPTARPGEAAKYAAQFPGDSARADTVATIVALDQAIGRILDKLQQTGLASNTIVFLFADNGGHPENRSENLPLRDYKWSVYEGGIRVPFLAAYPGVFPAGLVYTNPISSLDIYPTVAALAGVPPPTNLDGVNLTPFLTGRKQTEPHDALFFSMDRAEAVRQGKWKLVLAADGTSHLFDLERDVAEQHDLANVEADRVKELTARWHAWAAQMPEKAQRAMAHLETAQEHLRDTIKD